MSASLIAEVKKRLSAICDLYHAIRDITAQVMADFSIQALDNAVQQRSLLLLRIDDERSALRKLLDPPAWKTYDRYWEIRRHIDVITRLDKEAITLVSARMNEVRKELSALTASSRAAGAYTRYSRF
ncbi:MAG: hypothetical protein JW768_12470 [Chitinispirillaceae bacterium]|nr:hypothetical protein [Chitinispirillaceae bacterium]